MENHRLAEQTDMATILGEEWRRITFPSDEEDSESDLPGDADSDDSLPDAQAENNVSFSETSETQLMNDTFAGDTHNATKHRPANKKRTRKFSVEDSESSVSLPSEKKLKMTKAELQNVNSFTGSKIFEPNFTPRKMRNSQQFWCF